MCLVKPLPGLRRPPPPILEDSELLAFSAGVFNSEGTQKVERRRRGLPSFVIRVKACDRSIVENVARAWGTALLLTKERGCDPEISQNSLGYKWAAEARGLRAKVVVRTYKEKGWLSREKEIKIRRLQRELNSRIF